ncbi:unnamed protein product [Calicophoron daubneyi]|uniref:Histone acetyltransferase n=1 Tax=Calicophoron daubneyi TaxID=300641 RepID=A0AAV2TKX2_CALDB
MKVEWVKLLLLIHSIEVCTGTLWKSCKTCGDHAEAWKSCPAEDHNCQDNLKWDLIYCLRYTCNDFGTYDITNRRTYPGKINAKVNTIKLQSQLRCATFTPIDCCDPTSSSWLFECTFSGVPDETCRKPMRKSRTQRQFCLPLHLLEKLFLEYSHAEKILDPKPNKENLNPLSRQPNLKPFGGKKVRSAQEGDSRRRLLSTIPHSSSDVHQNSSNQLIFNGAYVHLHSFRCLDGISPVAGVVDEANHFYWMKKPFGGSKGRGRRKIVKSNQAIISWARKQKQKSLNPSACHATQRTTQFRCPLNDCCGFGHVNGLDITHVTLSGCPLFHNVCFEKWAEMRAREDGLVSPVRPTDNGHATAANTPEKSSKHIFMDRSHQFRTSKREPALDGLASQMEIYKFRCAQQRLICDKEREAKEHLLLCARIASQSGTENQSTASEHVHSLSPITSSGSTEHTGSALYQRIRSVIFGDWQIEPLYRSQYQSDIACLPTIYVCQYCLTPMRHEVAYSRHQLRCTWRFPPGDEIYRKENISFFEVDGERHPEYCQKLCLLTKLFLKHKTVYELDQVPSFLFYILTESNSEGFHIIGYFSKQKPDDTHDTGSNSVAYNNLSCILTLPQYQCHGYGRMLIELSYILSMLENRIGSPERPLSDLGLIIYRKYWRWEILTYLSHYQEKSIDIRTMSQELGIAIPDIVSTLLDMNMLAYFRTQYYIVNNKVEVDQLLFAMKPPDESKRIDKLCLHWTPHSIAPNSKSTRVPPTPKANTTPSVESGSTISVGSR